MLLIVGDSFVAKPSEKSWCKLFPIETKIIGFLGASEWRIYRSLINSVSIFKERITKIIVSHTDCAHHPYLRGEFDLTTYNAAGHKIPEYVLQWQQHCYDEPFYKYIHTKILQDIDLFCRKLEIPTIHVHWSDFDFIHKYGKTVYIKEYIPHKDEHLYQEPVHNHMTVLQNKILAENIWTILNK